MKNTETPPTTVSELGYLWTGYSINEMSTWFLTIFREHSSDEDIRNLFSLALQGANEILIGRKKILSKDGYPTPIGFSEIDIDTSSPPLFSDRFLLCYLYWGSQLGLKFHTRALALSTREDISLYYTECLHHAIQLHEKIVKVITNKKLYWRQPTVPPPPLQEYIHKSTYLNGWLGDTRPMNSMEIGNLYFTIDLLILIETLCIGFAQSAQTEEIIELFKSGATVVKKQYEVWTELLQEDDLPFPNPLLKEITNSKERIFSERIMVSHIAGLFGSLLSQYGFCLGTIMKHDLVKAYSRNIVKIGAFSEKITRFLIEKEWLEKVPGIDKSSS